MGIAGRRCGSQASSGAPLAVCAPVTAQAFDAPPPGAPASIAPWYASSSRPAASRTGAPVAVGARLRVVRVDEGGPCRAERREQLEALQLRLPVRGEAEHQEAAELQRVLRMPGLRLDVEQRVLRRQRGQAAHAGVDPRRVGEQQLAVIRIESREVAPGPVGEAKPSHQPVRLDAAPAHRLGDAPRRQPPLEVDLEEAILGVHEALPVDRARLAPRVDVRYAEAVAHDAHGLAQAGRLDRAVEARVGPPAARDGDGASGGGRLPRKRAQILEANHSAESVPQPGRAARVSRSRCARPPRRRRGRPRRRSPSAGRSCRRR